MRRVYLLVALLFIHVAAAHEYALTQDSVSFQSNNASNRLLEVKTRDSKTGKTLKFKRDGSSKRLSQLPKVIKRAIKNGKPRIVYHAEYEPQDSAEQDVTEEHHGETIKQNGLVNRSYSKPSREKFLVPFPSVEISKEDTFIVFPGSNFLKIPIRAHKLPIELMNYYSKASGILNDYGYKSQELKNFKKGYHDWIFKNILPEVNVHEYEFQDLSRVVRQIEGDYECNNVFFDRTDPLYLNESALDNCESPPFLPWFQYPTQPPPRSCNRRNKIANNLGNQQYFYTICGLSSFIVFMFFYFVISWWVDMESRRTVPVVRHSAPKGNVGWSRDIECMNVTTLLTAQTNRTLQWALEKEAEERIKKASILRKNARMLVSSIENDGDQSEDLKNDKFFWTVVKLLMKEDLEKP